MGTLNDRMRDYLSYKVKFLEFYYPFIFFNNATNLSFMKIQNYSLVLYIVVQLMIIFLEIPKQ